MNPRGFRSVAAGVSLGISGILVAAGWILSTREGNDTRGQEEGPAAASPVGIPRLDENSILVHGTITVHPEFEALVRSGGSLHLRVVDLRLRRPCDFRQYRDIQFPFDYAFRAKDSVRRRSCVEDDNFYVEAFYAQPGAGLYEDRGNQIGGEAWGIAGKPYPLRMGERADLVLASFWTPSLFKGKLVNRPDAYLEGWVYPTADLLPRVSTRNRVTIVIVKAPTVPGIADDPPIVLAAKVYDNVDPKRPLGYHFLEEDFLVQPVDRAWTAYFYARLESLDGEGNPTAYLVGGRASPKVVVGIADKGFKIVLDQEAPTDPFVTHGVSLPRLRVSEPTYE